MTENDFSNKGSRESAKPSLLVRQHQSLVDPGYALDLKCGTGGDSVFLAERGFQVEALDSRQDNLEKALRLAEKKRVSIDFQNLAAPDYKIRKNRYSLILCGSLFRHLNKSRANMLAERMITGLKTGGIIIGHVLTSSDPSCREFRRKKIPGAENNCFQMPGGWIFAFYDYREILGVFPDMQIIYYSENDIFRPGPGNSEWQGIAEFVFKKTARNKSGTLRNKE